MMPYQRETHHRSLTTLLRQLHQPSGQHEVEMSSPILHETSPVHWQLQIGTLQSVMHVHLCTRSVYSVGTAVLLLSNYRCRHLWGQQTPLNTQVPSTGSPQFTADLRSYGST